MASPHPQKIGKYTITHPLGRGAMGMVYEGHDPIIDRTVAIKVIRKGNFDDDEQQEAMDRFKREAQAAGKLSHAGIVMVYEYGEEEDTAFISMEYVRGRTLQDIMASDTLTISQVQDFMVQLLDGLEYAHSHHVIHRDIKPANIVYTNEGQIKIMDFGIARIESSTLTQVGTIMGTPAYMAPELFTGDAVDHRTDLFSAAVILYQLLTGLKPFTGTTMSIIMHQVVNVSPPHPSEVNQKLPKILDTLLRKSLAKQSSNRFQSAAEFKKELVRCFKKTAAQTKIVRQAAGTSSDQTIISKKSQRQTPTTRSRTPIFFWAGGFLLLVLAGLFFILERQNKSQQSPTAEPQELAAGETGQSIAPPPKPPIKIIQPASQKITRTTLPEPEQQPTQRTGISINNRRTDNDQSRSGSGIRITTPSRD